MGISLPDIQGIIFFCEGMLFVFIFEFHFDVLGFWRRYLKYGQDIFEHIFSHELHSERSHDFSSSDHGLQEKITHLLYHLKDNKGNVLGVLSGESGELFMRYFREYLAAMFEQYPEGIRQDVPREFALNHLVGSLAEAVRWWIKTKMELPPEKLAEDYLKLNGYDMI